MFLFIKGGYFPPLKPPLAAEFNNSGIFQNLCARNDAQKLFAPLLQPHTLRNLFLCMRLHAIAFFKILADY